MNIGHLGLLLAPELEGWEEGGERETAEINIDMTVTEEVNWIVFPACKNSNFEIPVINSVFTSAAALMHEILGTCTKQCYCNIQEHPDTSFIYTAFHIKGASYYLTK